MDKTDNERNEAPELPEQDEDDGKAPRKVLMSRELRGWVAGISALVVAVAAIGSTTDFSNLTGAVNARDVVTTPQVAAGTSCTGEDQTGGYGGQSVSCTFICDGPAGTVSVSADADDSDAHVSGTADCAGASAHCSGKNSCSAADTYDGSGTGDCSADSDEAVDSGLYVECSASKKDLPGPTEPPLGSEICPVTQPQQVCIQPVCGELQPYKAAGKVDPVQTCNTVWTKLAHIVGAGVSATGFEVQGSQVVGLQCNGFICMPFAITLT